MMREDAVERDKVRINQNDKSKDGGRDAERETERMRSPDVCIHTAEPCFYLLLHHIRFLYGAAFGRFMPLLSLLFLLLKITSKHLLWQSICSTVMSLKLV